MKIRDKLLLGFGFYIAFAIAAGFYAYSGLLKITTRLNLVETADDITNTILEVRRYEKNYLLFRDDESLGELREKIALLKEGIDNMQAEIIREIGPGNYTMIKDSIADYEKRFERVREMLGLQEELSTQIRTTGRDVERSLRGQELRAFLVLRRYEKNIMLYEDKSHYETFMEAYRSLKPEGDIYSYGILMSKLFELYREEKAAVEGMRVKAREIRSFTENLSKKERSEIGAALKTSRNIVVYTFAILVILGTLVNIKLATGIARPLRKLETVTRKMAEGDFPDLVQVGGRDEIASLQNSFNRMAGKLRTAMSSLEQTIEKLHEKQAQLVEAEKLASIGKLAAGIAHEINNPLTYVLTFSSLMLEQMPKDDPRHERLRMIVRETRRVRNIVRQVLSFAKEAPLKLEKMDVNQPLAEIIESLTEQDSFKDIELSLDLAKNLPKIDIDPVQIGQVVLNIALNAVHAITPPGKIKVTTRTAGNFVELTFSDTGEGIPEEHLKKIFDPFFTTKDKTKGTGLGMAVSYGIIKKHGGDIRIESTVGKGSTFIVRLPIHG